MGRGRGRQNLLPERAIPTRNLVHACCNVGTECRAVHQPLPSYPAQTSPLTHLVRAAMSALSAGPRAESDTASWESRALPVRPDSGAAKLTWGWLRWLGRRDKWWVGRKVGG